MGADMDAVNTRLDSPQGLMSVYTERAHLIALLARIYPSHGYVPDDAELGYSVAVCIHFPWGQATYHIADDDFAELFAPWLQNGPVDYDGHTTNHKYRAMQTAILDGEIGVTRNG